MLGSQSSGKSSVLENIVGRDFLPRGTGIVTRRPLVLQLINQPVSGKTREEVFGADSDTELSPDEWGEFLDLRGEKFYDFNKIRQEIVRQTELETGKGVAISPRPINLRIHSPNVLTLTLVDLPGLTKVPVGDQPKDIERLIRDMVYKYISRPNAVILAVTAANTDLANSDGLKLAREVDPEGLRTIGVLTKVDLMDAGTDVVDILAGKVIHLRLGYVPVVNRGQRDIDSKKKVKAALEGEKEFFMSHPSYRPKAKYCGTPYLARRLTTILMHHIRSTLPDIKTKIGQQLVKFQGELQSLGGALGEQNPSNVILTIITEFTNEFRTVIDGNSNDLSVTELAGGARISFVFHELFNNGVKSVDPFDSVKDTDIRTILYNSAGSAPSLFVGTTAFEVIVKQQIKRLEDPSLKCAQLVYEELVRILTQLLSKNQAFRRFPQLRERFNNVVIAFFRKCMAPTTKLVSDLIAAEAAYLNVAHPDFISGQQALAIVNERYNPTVPAPPANSKEAKAAAAQHPHAQEYEKEQNQGFFGSFFTRSQTAKQKAASLDAPPPSLKASGTLTSREQIELETVKLLVMSYFKVVQKTVSDMVPKAIVLELVNSAKTNMQAVLLQELYASGAVEELLKESDQVKLRRQEVLKMISALEKASEVVASVA